MFYVTYSIILLFVNSIYILLKADIQFNLISIFPIHIPSKSFTLFTADFCGNPNKSLKVWLYVLIHASYVQLFIFLSYITLESKYNNAPYLKCGTIYIIQVYNLIQIYVFCSSWNEL